MIKSVMLLVTLCVLATGLAQAAPHKKSNNDQSYLNSSIPAGALNGVAYEINGRVSGYNMDQYFRPASTEKVLTALAALEYLGPDYHFSTLLKVSSKSILSNNKLVVNNGVLNGDVEIEFQGDPTLRTEHLLNLLRASLKQSGINKINGDVYLNYGYFAGHNYATGWSWDDLTKCFTAPPSSVIIDGNCISMQLTARKLGAAPLVDFNQNLPIAIDVRNVETVQPAEYYGGCSLEVDRNTNNVYVLSGCIPLQKGKTKPLGLSFAIQDPERWAFGIIKNLLERLDISVAGKIVLVRKSQGSFTTFATYNSVPLRTILATCLKRSNNLYADSIAKTIGSVYYKRPANYFMAVTAIRNILKKKGIELGNSTTIDGSGLSPHNYITPRQMLNVLSYILKHDKELDFISLLPKAGVSGTMSGRGSVMRAPLLKNVTAKTGTLNGVANLAGFLTTQNGKLVPFVYFMNNLSYDERTRKLLEAHKIARPQYKHERKILEQIYHEQTITQP